MTTIRFHQTTTATPEQFIAGLTDFGPGRSKLFKNSDDAYLKVHNLGPHRADVTEGSGGVWERLYYDWSDPHHVTLKTIDSNLFGGASGHTYTLDTAGRRHNRHRRRACSRGQESQGTGGRGCARHHRQALVGQGVRRQRQGHRSPLASIVSMTIF